jgi:hypothetical protein
MSQSENQNRLPIWTCESTPPKGVDNLEALTVGQVFKVKCSGESVDWVDKEITIEVGDSTSKTMILRPIKNLSQSSTEVEWLVTSYVVGEHAPMDEAFAISSNAKVALQGLNFKVKSVITDEERQSGEAKPYPACGPIDPSWPWVTIGSYFFGFLLLILVLFLLARLQKKKRQQFADLENLKTLRAPSDELFYKLRKLEKFFSESNWAESTQEVKLELNKYLARKASFPAHLWKDRQNSKYLSSKLKKSDQNLVESYLKIQQEILRSQNSQVQKRESLVQIVSMIKDFATKLDEAIPDKKKGAK